MTRRDAMATREEVRVGLVIALGALRGQRLLLEYDATWVCERYSETWQGCYEEFAADKAGEFSHLEACRSCAAKKVVQA